MRVTKKTPTNKEEIKYFIDNISFELPVDFINFYQESNGGEIFTNNEYYIILWPLTEMIQLNVDYNVNEYAPNYFIFGSDGGDTAYCIEKTTGNIFEMPFIGMSNEEAIYKCKSLEDLFKS